EEIKEDFWAGRGIDLDSPEVELFERRIRAEEASGFMPHSNIAGSYLVLCGFVAFGIAITKWRRSCDGVSMAGAVATSLGTIAILYSVFLTKSLGALLAGGAGILLWLVVYLARHWINANRSKALIIGWACAVAALGSVVGYGLKYDRLPHMSLTFRWQYWTTSAALIADHPFTGVGRENFGQRYLQYKPIDYPEEVDNPHNFFVQSAADWGLLGLVGVLVCLVGTTNRLTRPRIPARSTEANTEGAPSSIIACGVVLLAVLTVARLPLLGADDVNFLYSNSVICAIAWAFGFGAFTVAQRSSDKAASDSSNIATAISIGLFVFLLHEMINFALFVPGSATTCFALLAVGIAYRSPVASIPRAPGHRLSWLALTAGVVLTIAVVLLAVRPVASASCSLARARQAAHNLAAGPVSAQPADAYFLDAIAADPLDPTPGVERAKWLLALTSTPTLRDDAFDAAVASLHIAIARDPFAIRLRRQLMQVFQAKAAYTRNAEDYLAAVDAANKALTLYPTDPDSMVSLADRQLEAGHAVPSDDLLRAALQTYQRALDLDASRPDWEHFRGFTDRQEKAIRAEIQQIQQRLKHAE
ncbi:MAG: O-antigen ligase family protein, partial [Planctomycetes bacterium]|nr:O-antigen ligase family protein [Planctomycetota bacterium]